MTNEEKLKEIEHHMTFSNSISAEPYAMIPASQYDWLINRVKALTEALEDLHPTLNARTQIERVNKALNDTGYRPLLKEEK